MVSERSFHDLPPIPLSLGRGQPMKANSIGRFAQWVEQHPEQIGTAYSANAVGRMINAHVIASDYLCGTHIYSVEAVRLLLPYLKDRRDELPAIALKIKQLTNGPITANAVKLGIL